MEQKKKLTGAVIKYNKEHNLINIEKDWYKPTGNAVKFTNEKLEGALVEIQLIAPDRKVYDFIKVLKEAPKKEALRLDEKISRHGALNTAIEILKLKVQQGYKIQDPILTEASKVADDVLKYVNKEE